MTYSRELRPRVAELNRALTELEFSKGSDSAKAIFNVIKQHLVRVLKNLNHIAKLKVSDQKPDSDSLQATLDVSQQSLFLARKKLEQLNQIRPFDDFRTDAYTDFDYLQDCFNSIVEVAVKVIPQQKTSFESLNYPSLALLHFDSEAEVDYSKAHRNLLLFALASLISPLSARDLNQSLSQVPKIYPVKTMQYFEDYDSIFKLYLSKLANLSLGLKDEINAIHKELIRVNSGANLTKNSALSNFLTGVLDATENAVLVDDIFDAIKNDEKYIEVSQTLLSSAFNIFHNAKLSQIVKLGLILYGLRVNERNQDSDFDLQQEDLLVVNDKFLSDDALFLRNVLMHCKQFLKTENNSVANQLSKYDFAIEQIVGIEDAQTRIANLVKNDSTQSYRRYRINELYKDYKVIFMEAGIHVWNLYKLYKAKNNQELISMLDTIAQTALHCNSINQKDAAKLIYILAKSFASKAIVKPNEEIEYTQARLIDLIFRNFANWSKKILWKN